MASVTIGQGTVNIKGDDRALDAALGALPGKVGASMAQVSRQVGMAMTAVGAAMAGVIGVSIRASNRFRDAMSEIAALGVKDLGYIEAGVKRLSVAYGVDLLDMVQAAYDVYSYTGLEGAAMMRILEKATVTAIAGVASVSDTVQLGTGTLNAFGLEATDIGKIMDQMFLSVQGGAVTISDLSNAVGRVTPLVDAAGLSTGEMFAAITALTKGNMKATEATTAFQATLRGVTDVLPSASKYASGLGLAFGAEALAAQKLAPFLENVRVATGGNVTAMGQLWGSGEAVTGVLLLTGKQAESFTELLGKMEGAVGVSDEAFQKFIENNPAQDWRVLKAEVEVLKVEIGALFDPIQKVLLGAIKPMVAGLREWIQANPEVAESVANIAAVVGVLFVAIGPLLLALPGLIVFFKGLIVVLGAVGAVMSGIPFVVFMVGAAIAGLVAVGYWVLAEWETIWGFITDVVRFHAGWISDLVGGMWEYVSGAFSWLMEHFGPGTIGGKLLTALGWIMPGLAEGGVVKGYAGGGETDARMVMVGERGPEVAFLPVGTRVVSNAEAKGAIRDGASGGGGDTIQVGPNYISKDVDADAFIAKLSRMLEQRKGARGIGLAGSFA